METSSAGLESPVDGSQPQDGGAGTTTIDIRLLGPVQANAGSRPLPAGPAQQRLVLAALAVDAGVPVAVETLIDRVWDDAPGGARSNLHVLVTRIRRMLDRSGAPVRLRRDPGGYVLTSEFCRVDLHRFRALVDAARDGTRGEHERLVLLRDAVGLWQGEPLAGVAGRWAARSREAWRQEYLHAVVAWANAEIGAGDAGRAVARLTDLVGEYPLVEPLAAALLRALHGAGRAAEASEKYHRIRQHMVEELGVEPGPELQTVHQMILRRRAGAVPLRQPDRGGGPWRGGSTTARVPVAPSTRTRLDDRAPHTLPVSIGDFTGRAAEIADVLSRTGFDGADRAPVVAVGGMPGVGKTTFVVHVAHLLAEHYPDGQLFLDLRGDEAPHPTATGEALGMLLAHVGIPAQRIPAGTTDRAELWRAETAHRRVLIVLDNAASATRVRPLLPGGRCLVLVAGNRRLTGIDGLWPVTLSPFGEAESTALMVRLVARASAEPDATRELVRRCGGLPLALRLAAERLLHHPRWRVTDLVERMRTASCVTTALASGSRSVRAAFESSLRQLQPGTRPVLTAIATHPDGPVSVPAVAALADLTIGDAEAGLTELVAVHLLQPVADGRYRLHGLVREHVLHTDPGPPSTQDGLLRLLDFYLATTVAATAHLELATTRAGVDSGTSPWALSFDAEADALAWLEAEWPQVVAAVDRAADLPASFGARRYVASLPRALWAYLYRYAHNHVTIRLFTRGLQVMTDDPADGRLTADLHRLVASAHARLGQAAEAEAHLNAAIAKCIELGEPLGEAGSRANLGQLQFRAGRLRAAVDTLRRASDMAHTAAGSGTLPLTDLMLGQMLRLTGDYAGALAVLRPRLVAARLTATSFLYCAALGEVGRVHLDRGNYVVAHALFTAAYRLYTVHGTLYGAAEILSDLGSVYSAIGDHDTAVANQRMAMDQMREFDDILGQCLVGNDLGLSLHAAGDREAATNQLRAALKYAELLGNIYEQARAHAGLAATASDDGTAAWHRERADELFDRAGVQTHARPRLRSVNRSG